MFIPEVFVNILRNLSRADLEAVQLAGPSCRDTVEQYFTDDGPLRRISAFKVRGQGRYRLKAGSDASVELQGSHNLFARLKSAFVEALLFSDGVAMEESFLSALAQIKDICQIRRCEIRAFASSDVCERALGELQCEEIRLNSVPSPLENRLMSFTSVQHCRCLFMGEIYCTMDVAAVALWLHRKKNRDTLPTLVLHEMNVNVHLLLNVLKEAFITGHESRSYELRIRAPSAASDIEEVRLKNVDLSERLTIITRHEMQAAGNPKPPQPELYLEWVLEAWYDRVTKDNVINSFKACGIGAIDGADDHLVHCLKEGSGIPNGMYDLTKASEAAEAQELAEILAGFEIEAPDDDDTGHVSDVEVVDDESAASGEEDSGTEDENRNLSDDSDF